MKKSFVILWTAVAGLLIFSWVYLPSLSRYRDLKMKQDELEHQIQDLDKKLKDIHEERDLLKNDVEYLEKVIRGELGLVKPGEIVYKFVQEQQEAANQLAKKATEQAQAQTTHAEPLKSLSAPQPVSGVKSEPQQAAAKPIPVVAPMPEAPASQEAVSQAMRKAVAERTPAAAKPASPSESEPVYPRQETR